MSIELNFGLRTINRSNGSVAYMVHFDVWRKRLGDRSLSKLKVVSGSDIHLNKEKKIVCYIYPKAKQHWLPFLIS